MVNTLSIRFLKEASQQICNLWIAFYDEYAAVYVDGGPERAARDAERMTEIEDFYTVIRFGPEASWDETVRRFGDVFRRRA